jgi:hypothetical protein
MFTDRHRNLIRGGACPPTVSTKKKKAAAEAFVPTFKTEDHSSP